jgi:hypothetical protein
MYLYRAIDSTGDTVDFWNHEYRLLAERKSASPPSLLTFPSVTHCNCQ